MFVSIVLLNFFIGSKSFASIIGVKCGSAWFYIIQAVFILECVGITLLALWMNIKEFRIKHEFNINIGTNDFKYNKKGIAELIVLGVVGGLLAGGLGLGGGVIFNPALLTLGYDAQVANSTGMFLVMISVLSSFITNIVASNVKVDYALWLSAWAIVAAVIGIFIGDWAVKKLKGRQSVLIWTLAVVFVITIVASIYSGID